MDANKKKIAGFVFLGLAAVSFVLIFIGVFVPHVAYDFGGRALKVTLSDKDGWAFLELASIGQNLQRNLSIAGYVIALVGALTLIAYMVLKLFFNKNIKVLATLGAIITMIGGILVFIGAGIASAKVNNPKGLSGSIEACDPSTGPILAVFGGIIALVTGLLARSKKFN